MHPLGHTLRWPLEHIADTSYWHYMLQLNLYAYILEVYYGYSVVHMEVACFHPENEKDFYSFEVPRMREETLRLVQLQEALAQDSIRIRRGSRILEA